MSLDVKIGATDAGFSKTISKVKDSVVSMDKSVEKTSNSVKTSFGSMVKAGAALAIGFGAIKAAAAMITGTFATFKEALDLGGELNDLSSRTGETAGNLMILRRAFDNAGAGADKVGPAINKLQKFMVESAEGNTANADTLTKLGLSFDQLKGKTPTEQMQMLAKAISGMSDPAARSAAAMQVFGRAGGELIPLFNDFSNEIARANGQLGDMPGVMDRSNRAFDAISDNLLVIKGKAVEFAAGFLEKVAPAIELATTLMANFNAAGAGMKLGEIITGASNAMAGFNDALSAIKLGEFGLAFELAFASIKLQAADSINSIAANVMAAIKASSTFLMTAFGPGSGIFTIIGAQFDVLAGKFSKAMIEGVKAVAGALTSMFDNKLMDAARLINPLLDGALNAIERVADGFDGALKNADRDITQAQNKISNATKQIAGDFVLAGQEAGKSFEEALASSKQLIDTTKMELDLNNQKLEIDKLVTAERAKAAAAATEGLVVQEEEIRVGKERITHAERIKELDADIASAKRLGNKEEIRELEAMKAFHEEMQASLEKGLTLQQALTNDTEARKNATVNIVNLTKKEKEQTEEIKANMISIKTVGDLIAQIKVAEPMKTFTERVKEARVQVKELKEFLGGDFSRMSIFDLAKKLGIQTARKEANELLVEVQKKLDEISNKKLNIEIDKNMTREELEALQKKIAAMDNKSVVTLDASSSIAGIRSDLREEIDLSLSSSKGSDLLTAISKAVDKIQSLVAKIEPKLPTAALGV